MSQVNVEFTFMGTEELRRKLKTIPATMRRTVVRTAAKAGAKVIQEQARDNVKAKFHKYATGNLAKNVGTKVRTRTVGSMGEVAVDIGPTKHAWYGRILETGSVKYAAHPWLRPAFDAKKDEAVRTVGVVFFSYLNTV